MPAIRVRCEAMADRLSVDVLVVGSGASGLAAAVTAESAGARVALATKGALQSCNSAKAQGGIQAAFGDDDSPEQHAEDVWQSSHETANRQLVEILTSQAPAAIQWLEEHGVEFTLEPAENGWRATCRRKNGEEVTIEAGSVVLAAGGRCYREAEERRELSTNHPGATGEVTTIALELGAESRDLDALQYHPNGGAWPPTMQGYSIPETTRAYGATLLNAGGEEFTDPLGPRDAVSQAIFDEVEAGRGVETPDGRPAVYLDTTRIPERDAEISLPYMLRRYRAGGIDPLHEPILTYPVLHYQNGGLVIDEDSQTTIEGLFACGEIAGGTHGRNRMMGNSLLECTVFGRRAGAAAAERAA